METAIVAGGCFWCMEAIYRRLVGVKEVVSGFIGGNVVHPTYKQVCNEETGHAEAVQITFDPQLITYMEILEIFWQSHDPTTLNQQGDDIGTQYRSVIFYTSEAQHQQALLSREQAQKLYFEAPIVTEILPAMEFYPAQEDYHQNYYENNTDRGYCIFSIAPKINKIHNLFNSKIKPQYQTIENENRTQKTL
jgi:peptide methionine sulfoxide reductase msrA